MSWQLPRLRFNWIGAKTEILKADCENVCPILDCRSPTQIRGDFDSYKNMERMYQVCTKCGTEFSVVYAKRPEPKIDIKRAKQLFGG